MQINAAPPLRPPTAPRPGPARGAEASGRPGGWGGDNRPLLAAIVESSDSALVAAGLDGTILAWNPAAERLYGYPRHEMVGSSLARITPPDRADEMPRLLHVLMRGEPVEPFETVRIRRDGRRLHVSLAVSPIRDKSRALLGVSILAHDASGRQSTQMAQREAFARLRAVFETAADGIITIDERGEIETMNPAALRMFGCDASAPVQGNIRSLIPGLCDPDRTLRDCLGANGSGGGGWGREVEGRRLDGAIFPMELTVSETELWDRTIFTCIMRDISSRRRAEQALRVSEQRFRLMADGAPVLIWMSAGDKARTWFNRRWLEYTGRTMEQERSDGWMEGIHPDELGAYVDAFRAAAEAGSPFEIEYRLRRFDGEFRWLRDAGVPLRTVEGGLAGYVGSCIDVTEHRRGEELLRERVAQRTEELIVANQRLHHQVEQRRRIQALLTAENGVLELIATRTPLDEVLMAIRRSVETLLPEARCRFRLAEARASSGAAIQLNGNGNGKDVASPHGDGVRIADQRAEKADEAAHGDPASRRAGHWTGSSWAEPIRGAGDSVLGTLSLHCANQAQPSRPALQTVAAAARLAALAIERARSEERAREQLDQLAHVARLATMGEMASGLAHELNQPLCAILNYVEAGLELIGNSKSTKDLQVAMNEVRRQTERAGEVIRRLRDFLRRHEPQREPIQLNDLVRDVQALIASDARHHDVRVRLKLANRLPRALADPIQIQQVVINLVRNGIEALRDADARKRTLTIETARRRPMIELAVHDAGGGVPADQIARIFDPFHTTKAEGMGMGLSISRSIVEVHDGAIWVERNEDGGATFRFTLPTAGRKRRA